jgi:hypothetical protein
MFELWIFLKMFVSYIYTIQIALSKGVNYITNIKLYQNQLIDQKFQIQRIFRFNFEKSFLFVPIYSIRKYDNFCFRNLKKTSLSLSWCLFELCKILICLEKYKLFRTCMHAAGNDCFHSATAVRR